MLDYQPAKFFRRRKRILIKPSKFGRELGGLAKMNRSAEWQTPNKELRAPDSLADRAVSKWAEKLLRAGTSASSVEPLPRIQAARVLEYRSVGRARDAPASTDAGESTALWPNCTPRNPALMLLSGWRTSIARSRVFGPKKLRPKCSVRLCSISLSMLSRFSSPCGKGAKLNRRSDRTLPCRAEAFAVFAGCNPY